MKSLFTSHSPLYRTISVLFILSILSLPTLGAEYDFISSVPSSWTASPDPNGYETTNLTRGAYWQKNATLTLSSQTNITYVKIICSTNKANNKISVKVGSTTFGTETLTSNARHSELSFSGTSTTGNVVVSIDRNDGSIWIEKIEVTSGGGGGGSTINVTLSCKGNTKTITATSPYTLPTTIDDADKCDGWDFAGWSATEFSPTNTAPSFITELTNDGDLAYAVYKQGGSGGGGDVVFTFSAMGLSNGSHTKTFTITPITITAEDGTGTNEAGYYSTSDNTWRVYKDNIISIESTSGSVTSVSSTPDASFTISGGKATLTPSGTIKFKSITVTTSGGSGAGTTYTTSCDAASSTELEIVEWNTDYINIMVPDPSSASVVIEDKNENTTTPVLADDIFFSKYYEAASNMKLFAIFNGTGAPIDLRNYRVRSSTGNGNAAYNWGTVKGDLNFIAFKDISKLNSDYGYMLPTGTELIFWSNNKALDNPTYKKNNEDLRECIAMTIEGNNYDYDDLENDNVPNWYCLGDKEDYNITDADGNNQFNFNGDDPLVLEEKKGSTWEAIDFIGAQNGRTNTEQITTKYQIQEGKAKQPLNDNPGGWYADYSGGKKLDIPLSTNRYMLIRKSFVRSGDNAVAHNKNDFLTLGDYEYGGVDYEGEWLGVPVGAAQTGVDDNCYSGKEFSEVGQFNYSESYQQYEYVTDVDEFKASDQNPDGSYTVSIPHLDTLSCTKLKINLYNSGVITATNIYDVPIMVKTGKQTTDEIFHNYNKTADICKECDVIILRDAVLTKATNGAAGDVTEIRDLTVYPGGKLNIPAAGGTYKVRNIQFRVEGDTVPPCAVLDGNLETSTDSLRVSRRINNNRYYFFSLPYDCKVSDIRWSNGETPVLDTDYRILKYDGATRAGSGKLDSWIAVTSSETLTDGTGYTIAVSSSVVKELVFPMAIEMANLSAAEKVKGDAKVPVKQYTGSTTKENHNWNLIAHPYVSQFGAYTGDNIKAGWLKWNGSDDWEYVDNTHVYVTVPNYKKEDRITASDYTQTLASTLTSMDPFLAVFVQAAGDGDVIFSQTNRKNSAPARHLAAKSEYEDESVFVGVVLSHNGKTDQASLRVRQDFTNDYQLGYDLVKLSTRNDEHPCVYMQRASQRLAFQAVSDENAAKDLPMGVYAKAPGTYTFSLNSHYPVDQVEAVYLYDAETGLTTNLLNDTYSFTTNAELETSTRFFLSAIVRRNVPGVATGCEQIDIDSPMTRKVLIDGHVYIQREGKLFDITGKQMVNY